MLTPTKNCRRAIAAASLLAAALPALPADESTRAARALHRPDLQRDSFAQVGETFKFAGTLLSAAAGSAILAGAMYWMTQRRR